MSEPREYTRGYLPHRSVPGATQFLTWRLADALDADGWVEWKARYQGETDRSKLYRLAEDALDRHAGAAHFRLVPAGRIVMESLFDRETLGYRVLAAVVMPNHVHAVLRVDHATDLGDMMQSIKGGSAREVNRFLRRGGRLWQPDYFDRLIRSSEHLDRCIAYVHWNPVKAGLCDDPKRYANSTANERYAEWVRTEVRRPDAG